MHVLIENGTVVNTNGRAKQDLLIESGTIHRLGSNILPQPPYEEVDATGYYVSPGGADIHMRFNTDIGITRSYDGFLTGIRTAARGGATTTINYTGFDPSDCRLHHQLGVYRGYVAHKAVIDYSFHGVVRYINHAILDEIPMITEEGLSGSKLYLTYQYKLNDGEVLQTLRRLHESDTLTIVHLENDAAIVSERAEFIAAELTAPCYHALGRLLEYKAEAIVRVINLAQIAGNASLYIVHLSNDLDLDCLRLARANHQPIRAKTCSQYLLLDERSYNAEDGVKLIPSSPLRNVRKQDKLWCGISDGATDVVATDHCTFSTAQRLQISKDDLSHYPNGLPGVGNHMQLLFPSDVMMGRIIPERFVELTSAIPAGLFGLWP